MLAEVRLIVAQKEARLVFKTGETIVEDELWTFDGKLSRTEAGEIARAMFDDCFDLMQYSVYGDSDGE
jgi:hypothetical protein